MSETRVQSERYALIGRELIGTEPALEGLAASRARIAFLSSDGKRTSNGRAVMGRCERVPARYKWCVPYDFTVTVFEPNVQGLDEAQLRTLLLHELLHAGVDVLEDGTERYYVVPHDVEDFREVVDRFGLDWASAAE